MHIPLRMCVVCREHKPTQELIRVTYNAKTDKAEPDKDSKNTGRGAYICKSAECIKKARKKHVAERHLGCSAIDDLYDELEGLL